jgi:hypothetical protein
MEPGCAWVTFTCTRHSLCFSVCYSHFVCRKYWGSNVGALLPAQHDWVDQILCVRDLDSVLPVSCHAGDLPPVSTTTAVSMVQAVRSALLMYEYVVQLAAMDAPHGANPTSKRAGLVTPSGAPVQAASSTAPLCSTVPAASSRSAATPTTPVVSKTNASRERASGGKGDVVSSEDLLPPDFQRHCAAVASWGPNLSCIMALATLSLRMMHRPCMLGNASHMLSWGKGGPCLSDTGSYLACAV